MPRCDLIEPGKSFFQQGVSDAEFKQNKSLTLYNCFGTGAIGRAPDEVLLDIFDFYRQAVMDTQDGNWRWRTLAHVCRRWRHLVITSPRRLDLRLLCTHRTSVRMYLNCWPTFPIAIKYNRPFSEDVFNIFVALENRDRVCSIQLSAGTSLLERVSRVMQVPFPALKNLSLEETSCDTGTISDFLGGVSVPGLQKLSLCSAPSSARSSALPKFLLSCTDLVDLQLMGLIKPDHTPPEMIVAILSGLSRLKVLYLDVSTLPLTVTLPLRRSSPLPLNPRPTRTVLSDLTFYGRGDYLEDLIARIDAPFLQRITLHYEHWLTDAPQLRQLICRAEGLRSPNQARIIELERAIDLRFRSTESPIVIYPAIKFQSKNFNVALKFFDWNITSATQFCLQSVPLLSGVKQLIVDSRERREDEGPADWLDLFRPFSAVEELYVNRPLGYPVAFSLAGATEKAEILPALRSIFFYSEGAKESASLKKTIMPFFAARRLSMSHCHVSAYSVERF